MKNYFAIFLVVFLSSTTALADPVETQKVMAGTWQPVETGFARVSARQQTQLSLPFAIRITRLNTEPGSTVTAGDELARFEAPVLRLHLATWYLARQELVLARKRLQLLHENEKEHTITRRDLTLGEQAVAAAQSKTGMAWERLAADLDIIHLNVKADKLVQDIKTQGLQTAAKQLGRLRAPFTGVVTARQTSLGEQLAAGAPILQLEALDNMYIDVGVTENSLPTWRNGETIWHGNSSNIFFQPVAGLPRYNPATGLWLIRFKASNPGNVLREGNWIEVEHLSPAEPVVWLPASAVVARDGKTWAMVQQKSLFKAVEIEVGVAAADGRIPVTKGIQPGSMVVSKGAYELLYRDIKALIQFND